MHDLIENITFSIIIRKRIQLSVYQYDEKCTAAKDIECAS